MQTEATRAASQRRSVAGETPVRVEEILENAERDGAIEPSKMG